MNAQLNFLGPVYDSLSQEVQDLLEREPQLSFPEVLRRCASYRGIPITPEITYFFGEVSTIRRAYQRIKNESD